MAVTTTRSGRVRDRYRLESMFRRYPPRRYSLDDYQRWFAKTGEVFERYLKRLDPPASASRTASKIGVVVVPWVNTPVPWYAIMLALGLARRGREVVILWDDTGFPEREIGRQNRVVGKVLSSPYQPLQVVRLTEHLSQRSAADADSLIQSLTEQNLTWIQRGGPPNESQTNLRADVRISLTGSIEHIRGALEDTEPDCVLLPGGVYGTSGLFVHEASSRGIRVATFDTDRRVAQICVDGVAAQNGDIARAFRALWDESGTTRRDAIGIALDELQNRSANRDSYGFQALPAIGPTSGSDGSVLIPLNVEWDTAALGRHRLFEDTIEWITSTVETVLRRDHGPVIVRQHPSERRKLQRSRLDVESALREHFGDDPRCHFVAADDPISSYDLLRSARLVLPYVSTIAMEAAALGKPVLISGDAYYSDLGFVWSAGSRAEYFELLEKGLDGRLDLLPDQRDRALACYYLSAVRNRITTDFTPHPDDFWTWCRRPADSLFGEPEVSDILEAIDCDVPISLLRHRRSLNDGP